MLSRETSQVCVGEPWGAPPGWPGSQEEALGARVLPLWEPSLGGLQHPASGRCTGSCISGHCLGTRKALVRLSCWGRLSSGLYSLRVLLLCTTVCRLTAMSPK